MLSDSLRRAALASIALLRAVVCSTLAFAPAAAADDTPHAAGSGFPVYSGDDGSIRLRVFATFRYLNQTAIDDTYTDSFGATKAMDPRQDFQFNKAILYAYGWVADPRFRYLAYVWSSNASQGQGAQVVVAGNLGWKASPAFDLGLGIGALPGARSTLGNWPNWLASDSRLIADEYFRPSYTTGIWSKGRITHGLDYMLMLGNNLSQLGIDGGQLDNGLNTISGSLQWKPTTGEYGPLGGYGDFESHTDVATLLGAYYTRSDENRQGQPSTEAPENSQIRLSDGSVIFTPGLFAPGSVVTDVRYRMTSLSAGVKHRGFALEGDWFLRQVDDIRGFETDALGFEQLDDTGGQIEASAMLVPKSLQAYGGWAAIDGEYGDPWQVRAGVNWFPAKSKAIRANAEWIYVEGSPVGALSLPLTVGATGAIYTANLEFNW